MYSDVIFSLVAQDGDGGEGATTTGNLAGSNSNSNASALFFCSFV
jgi:hypothetical protein